MSASMSAPCPAGRSLTAGEDVVARFLSALAAEKDAARRADVDALVALQAEKRALLPALQKAPIPAGVQARLRAEAQRNVVLLRQLVQGLAALLGQPGERLYNASGMPDPAATGILRGRL